MTNNIQASYYAYMNVSVETGNTSSGQKSGGSDFDAILNQCAKAADDGKSSPKAAGSSGLISISSLLSAGIFSVNEDGEGDPLMRMMDDLFTKIKAQRQDQADQTGATTDAQGTEAAKGSFGFSDAFTSTFGSSGPLIDWINNVTARLGLNAEQNAALQSISINHKDTNGSLEDIAQIGKELSAAGIGA